MIANGNRILQVGLILFAWSLGDSSPVAAQGRSAKTPADAVKPGKGKNGDSLPVDFRNDVMPILTRQGCNVGACHGAARGRGGFRLSLYGGNPLADHEAIVRHLKGRRVHFADPENSLLLRKATESIQHGGGEVLSWDNPLTETLVDWIAQGAQLGQSDLPTRIELQPSRAELKSTSDRLSIQVFAKGPNGQSRDVTELTVLTAEDSSAVEIQREPVTITVNRPGRHVVIARYLNHVVPLQISLPFGGNAAAVNSSAAQRKQQHLVDRYIDRSLHSLGLPASGQVNDQIWLRRLCLDLTGRLPEFTELDQDQYDLSQADDRQRVIDELLQSPQFVQFWTFKFSQWLRVRPQLSDAQAVRQYRDWIADQIRGGVSYQQMARELILASGNSQQIGPANFYRTAQSPRLQAEFFSEFFMASRMRCANCHNHPLDRWTQDDYHGLAAIFAKIPTRPVVEVNPFGQVIHPRTLQPAVQRLPGERFLEQTEDVLKGDRGRQALASWLVDSQNPYFAKAFVNRLWNHMMGRGLVHPVDDFRDTNPPTHPELLSVMAGDFTDNGYDLRHTLRLIATSQAYARSSDVLPGNQHDNKFYSHALPRPLIAEVMADAISDVTGVAERYAEMPIGTRATELVVTNVRTRTLEVLGQCDRSDSCETGSLPVDALAQNLHLLNGPLLNQKLDAPQGRLHRLLAAGHRADDVIDQFYIAAYNRKPNADEQQFWQQQLRAVGQDRQLQREVLNDCVWSLLNSFEFKHH